jgi:hypothetical protein
MTADYYISYEPVSICPAVGWRVCVRRKAGGWLFLRGAGQAVNEPELVS